MIQLNNCLVCTRALLKTNVWNIISNPWEKIGWLEPQRFKINVQENRWGTQNRQHRDTDNIGHTRHRDTTNQAQGYDKQDTGIRQTRHKDTTNKTQGYDKQDTGIRQIRHRDTTNKTQGYDKQYTKLQRRKQTLWATRTPSITGG